MTEAWLHRRGKPTWHFTPNHLYGGPCCFTRHGTVYRINCLYPYGSFEVAKLQPSGAWSDVTKELRAYSIEFADGGVYTFPGKRVK